MSWHYWIAFYLLRSMPRHQEADYLEIHNVSGSSGSFQCIFIPLKKNTVCTCVSVVPHNVYGAQRTTLWNPLALSPLHGSQGLNWSQRAGTASTFTHRVILLALAVCLLSFYFWWQVLMYTGLKLSKLPRIFLNFPSSRLCLLRVWTTGTYHHTRLYCSVRDPT